jgi:phosphatidylethanolamine-binding protein
MPTTQEKKQAFVEHKVITDVLPGNIDLSYDLIVKWPATTLDKPGAELDREATQPEPALHLSPAVCQSHM